MAGLDKPLVAALSKAPGVGPTTCSKLLQQCGTLAALAAHTQQVGRRGDPTFFQGSCMTMWLWRVQELVAIGVTVGVSEAAAVKVFNFLHVPQRGA